MSSLVRRIQRSPGYMGRGTKLGAKNPNDASLIARLKREEKRRAQK